MSKSRDSGAYAQVKRDAISAKSAYKRAADETKTLRDASMLKDVSRLAPGDHVSIGGGGKYPTIYNGDVVSVGKKNVKIKTRSQQYGEQVISLPKDLYRAHIPSSAVPKLEAAFARVEKLGDRYLNLVKKLNNRDFAKIAR